MPPATIASASLPPGSAPAASIPAGTSNPGSSAGPGQTVDEPKFARYLARVAFHVNVPELNIRATPSTAGTKVAVARRGDIIVVYDHRVEADGFVWYFGYPAVQAPGVLPSLPESLDPRIDPPFGWLAAGTAADPYMLPIAPRCPTEVDVETVVAMLDSERLACFGARSIGVEGTYGCRGCGGVVTGTYEPPWLAGREHPDFPFALHFPPSGLQPPPQATIIRVRGHFDDPAASTCVIHEGVGLEGTLEPIGTALSVDYCRRRFVVETYEVLGPDPSFEGG